jgi:hypothetical protein
MVSEEIWKVQKNLSLLHSCARVLQSFLCNQIVTIARAKRAKNRATPENWNSCYLTAGKEVYLDFVSDRELVVSGFKTPGFNRLYTSAVIPGSHKGRKSISG